MTEYRRQRLTPAGRGFNAVRQLAQLPYFARNVVYKVLILLGLRRVTQMLGHSGEWPY